MTAKPPPSPEEAAQHRSWRRWTIGSVVVLVLLLLPFAALWIYDARLVAEADHLIAKLDRELPGWREPRPDLKSRRRLETARIRCSSSEGSWPFCPRSGTRSSSRAPIPISVPILIRRRACSEAGRGRSGRRLEAKHRRPRRGPDAEGRPGRSVRTDAFGGRDALDLLREDVRGSNAAVLASVRELRCGPARRDRPGLERLPSAARGRQGSSGGRADRRAHPHVGGLDHRQEHGTNTGPRRGRRRGSGGDAKARLAEEARKPSCISRVCRRSAPSGYVKFGEMLANPNDPSKQGMSPSRSD